MKYQNKKKGNCPNCGKYGVHFGHHCFNSANKKKSELHNSIEYWCSACHITNTDSIHNNATLRKQLKRKHQLRIMEEEEMSEQEFIVIFGKSYLWEK